jgi:hypothetical protein
MARLGLKILIGGIGAVAIGSAIGNAIPISPPRLNQAEKVQLVRHQAAEQARADAGHCLGWDDSVDGLEQFVKENLRNPKSFEHVRTSVGPIGKDGKFAAVMTYRAQNGFGGMNVESIGAIVDANSCEFQIAAADDLMKRLGN